MITEIATSLSRIAQAFAAAQPKKFLGSSGMPLGLKKPEKSAIANHGNRFRKIDLR